MSGLNINFFFPPRITYFTYFLELVGCYVWALFLLARFYQKNRQSKASDQHTSLFQQQLLMKSEFSWKYSST